MPSVPPTRAGWRRPASVAAVTVLFATAAGLAAAGRGTSPTLPPADPSVTAADLRPSPPRSTRDRGQFWHDGCIERRRRPSRCIYGKRRSRTTVVLFGDSEAGQFWAPLVRIARDRGWRLVTRLRPGCGPASIRFSYRCDRWRRATIRAIVRRDRPRLIVVTSGVAYRAVHRGRRLSSRASQSHLRRGYIRTLKRLRRSRARIAVIKDTPRSPRNVPKCVMRHGRDVHRCDFSRRQKTNRSFDRSAARRVRGVKLVDPTPLVCPGKTCPVVFGRVLAYRDDTHFTATLAATFEPWLAKHLPKPARRSRAKR